MHQPSLVGTIALALVTAVSCHKSDSADVDASPPGRADAGPPTSSGTGGSVGAGGHVGTGGVGASPSTATGGSAGTGGRDAGTPGGSGGSAGMKGSAGGSGIGGSRADTGPSAGGSVATGGRAVDGGGDHTGGRGDPAGGSGGHAGIDGGLDSRGGTATDGSSGALPGSTAAGHVPASLPSHMLVGVFAQDNDETWMKQSGTPWDVRWVYLAGQHGNDWYNLWGWGSADGAWATDWFTTCDKQGFIPGIHLYNIGYGHDRGDSGLLTEIRDATFVANYFTEFKALMQKAKAFGKPVVVVLEGDSFGMIEMLSNNDPNAAAAIASSGMPDLAGLPDTIAGLGLAYLQIRKAVGATNVALAPDIPAYAANGDILNGDNTDLGPHVDYQMKFFGPFGFADNVTGARFDLAASNPLSGDADYYRLVGGDSGRWWDASDTASVNSKSFNRYAEWLHLFNQASGSRWILHQVPVGNSNMLNVDSDCKSPTDKCTPRTGYKDNRAEYFLNYDPPSSTAIRDQHLAKFADAGLIGLLFGAGDGGSTTPYNDTWTDGQPFLKSRVGELFGVGGFAIAP